MPNQFQAGTIMVHHSAILESLELESEPFRRNWWRAGDYLEPLIWSDWCPPQSTNRGSIRAAFFCELQQTRPLIPDS